MKHLFGVSFIVCVYGVNISFSTLDDSNISEEKYNKEVPCNYHNNNDCNNRKNDNIISNDIKDDIERRLSKYHREMKGDDSVSWDLVKMENKARKNTTIGVSDRRYQGISASKESMENEGTLAQYPYSVSIQKKGSHYATGALVGVRWVMTTAAEFYNVREILKLFRMRFGSVDCKRRGIVVAVKNVYPHPSYAPGSPGHDVALLETATVVPQGPAVKPISLSKTTGRVVSAKFLVTYWPRIVVKKHIILPPSAKERHLHSYMRVSTQRLVPVNSCNKQMEMANLTLPPNSLCLNPILIHHSVCMPDVGAPVIAEDGLWGITSGWVSPLCPDKPGPTLFTRVTAMSIKLWVNKLMREGNL